MIVAMVCKVGHHMRPADLGGVCWSDGRWGDLVYSHRHKKVVGFHPCSGWYSTNILRARKVV